MNITKGLPFPVPQQQPDRTISQANPVTATWYNLLPATSNVRIIGINAGITWAVTQPTPLSVRIIIDGVTFIHSVTNPVSASLYTVLRHGLWGDEATQPLFGGAADSLMSFVYEGRTVCIDIMITWAITQPTPLTARLRWARW